MRTDDLCWIFLQFWAQLIFLLFFGIRLYGQRNVPSAGGAILASSHQSYLDPIIVGLGLSRQIHFMARDNLFENALFRRLIEFLNAFPVARDSADLRALREGIRRLRAGHLLVLFPEGTRTRTGEIGQIHPGLALMADRAKVPVVPVTIEGAFDIWPRGRRLPRPGKIRVMFGEPIRVASAGRDDMEHFVADLRRRLLTQQERLRAIDRLSRRRRRQAG